MAGDTHRLAVCWDNPDSGKLDLKEFFQYCWETKGIIADAINEAADGVVSVSQSGNYKKYADAIRKMKKRIWSSADDTTAPLKCIITNSDMQYGKWLNYGYVDINKISQDRFGDYDKYYAASSFIVDIYNPPVYVDDGHVEGDMTYDPTTSTADISGLASASVADSTAESFAAALYSVLLELFPDAYPDAAGVRFIHLPSLHAIIHVSLSSPYQINWIFGDNVQDREAGGVAIPNGVSTVYGIRDKSKDLFIIFTDNGTQYFFANDGEYYWFAGNDNSRISAWNRNYGIHPDDFGSDRSSYNFFQGTNHVGSGTPIAPSNYGIFKHKESAYLNESRQVFRSIDTGKLKIGYWYSWGTKPLFSKFTCDGKVFRYLGNQYYWEVSNGD